MPVASLLDASLPVYHLLFRGWCGRSTAAGAQFKKSSSFVLLLNCAASACALCRAGKDSVARQAACSQVQSKPSRTQTRRQLGCSPPGTLNADVAEVSDPEIVGDAGQPVQRELNQPDGRPVPRDPNVAGFVPAFILGKVYLCKVPERQVLASKPCKQATGAHEGSNVTSSRKPLCAFYASPCTLRAVLFALTCLLEVHTCEVLSCAEAARASQ